MSPRSPQVCRCSLAVRAPRLLLQLTQQGALWAFEAWAPGRGCWSLREAAREIRVVRGPSPEARAHLPAQDPGRLWWQGCACVCAWLCVHRVCARMFACPGVSVCTRAFVTCVHMGTRAEMCLCTHSHVPVCTRVCAHLQCCVSMCVHMRVWYMHAHTRV